MIQTAQLAITVNGKSWTGEVPVETQLLDLLRTHLGLIGTKRGCESEVCGACTVLIDGIPVSSCNYLAFEANGKTVTTIEGLETNGELHPLQAAFMRNVAAQCGYCTPGQILAAVALLQENASPTYEEIARWMTGNICRCGCYPAIATAIREVSEETGSRA